SGPGEVRRVDADQVLGSFSARGIALSTELLTDTLRSALVAQGLPPTDTSVVLFPSHGLDRLILSRQTAAARRAAGRPVVRTIGQIAFTSAGADFVVHTLELADHTLVELDGPVPGGVS